MIDGEGKKPKITKEIFTESLKPPQEKKWNMDDILENVQKKRQI